MRLRNVEAEEGAGECVISGLRLTKNQMTTLGGAEVLGAANRDVHETTFSSAAQGWLALQEKVGG